ncbi:hypothetical protein [Demequina lutea]|uniref:P/Homo B domain-containing protein n=1 Tax=Demequina lutea TaxID=431489 RepID=A0A7Y9Z776_9MICO|nr:hypothetical protein [Demequina lutea]NYI40024.1 hypothetical protein [Demequina lutea]
MTIVTSYWDESQNGFVVTAFANVLVPKATCTATATKGTAHAQITTDATPGATTTDCGTMLFPDGVLSTGQWTITVSFESADYSGVSGKTTGIVP